MTLTSYAKNCTIKKAGNSNKLFLAKISQVNDLTVVADEVTAVSMVATNTFAELNADLHSVVFTSEGQGKTGYFNAQTLVANYSKKTTTLQKTIDELKDGVVCGLVAIRVDGNRNCWISGISTAEQEGKSLPWDSITDSFTSGASIEDFEEGDKFIISLMRTSGVTELRLAPAVAEGILDGTSPLIAWIV